MKNHVQEGKVLDFTAGGNVSGGDPVVIGNVLAVLITDLASGNTGAILTEGVVTLKKATGETWALGDLLYYDATAKHVTKTAKPVFAGMATAAAGSTDAEGNVKLPGIAFPQVANVEALGGNLTGVTNGELEDIPAISLSTTDTYSDAAVNAAVNAAITAANLQIKELQVKFNELLAAFKAMGGMVADSE